MSCNPFLILSVVLLVFHDTEAVPRITPLQDDGYPIVNTNVGTIRGLKAEDGDYSMFMGIPFAEVDSDNPFGVSSQNLRCNIKLVLLIRIIFSKTDILFIQF